MARKQAITEICFFWNQPLFWVSLFIPARLDALGRRVYRLGMNQTIDAAFNQHWKNLVAKDPKLAQYPKSFQTLLRDTFEAGYLVGSTDRQIELEAHRGN